MQWTRTFWCCIVIRLFRPFFRLFGCEQPTVGEEYGVIAVDKDVRWFDEAMWDALGVQRGECFCEAMDPIEEEDSPIFLG